MLSSIANLLNFFPGYFLDTKAYNFFQFGNYTVNGKKLLTLNPCQLWYVVIIWMANFKGTVIWILDIKFKSTQNRLGG